MTPKQADAVVPKPRRFYTTATVAEVNGGWALRLDGRGARTPAGAPLALPTRALGERVAAEWAAQGEQIDAEAMPLTRLAATAIDRAPVARDDMAAEVARYASADLLCYFAEAPRELVLRQDAEWGPWLDWTERELGVRLIRAEGVMHRLQPPESLERVRALAAALDDFALSGLVYAAALYGSAVLAFAVQLGALGGEAARDLSRLDERFQAERWGEDSEAAARAEALRQDAGVIGGWFADQRE